MTTTTVRRLKQVTNLVDYAADSGAATPFSITVHADGVSAGFASVAQLADWALLFEAAITERELGDKVMHEAYVGQVDRVRLWCLQRRRPLQLVEQVGA